MFDIEPELAAGIRSSAAGASALSSTSTIRCAVSTLPPATAAGASLAADAANPPVLTEIIVTAQKRALRRADNKNLVPGEAVGMGKEEILAAFYGTVSYQRGERGCRRKRGLLLALADRSPFEAFGHQEADRAP